MSAVRMPIADEIVSIDRGAVLYLLGDAYGGAGTFAERQWHISTTNSFPASAPNLVWDSGLRENDNRLHGERWAELWPELHEGFTSGLTLYVAYKDRNTLGASSSWSTGVRFYTASAVLSRAEQEAAA